MNKDTVLATGIGLVLGFVITGLILIGPKLLAWLPRPSLPKISFNLPNKVAQTKSTPIPTPKTAILTISSPLPESIETNDQLVVSGIAQPNATVVVSGGIEDDVSLANAEGKFAGKITLIEGINNISVTSYANTVPTTQMVTVYFTQESL